MAVVEIQDCRAAAFDNGRTVIKAVLIGVQRESAIEFVGNTVRQLDDVLESNRFKAGAHAVRDKSGNNNFHRWVELPQRRIVKVIEVTVRDVNTVDLKEVWRDIHRFWEMPPRTPIAGTDQPRIHEKPAAIALDEHAGMT